ncbi:hypothetical protein P4U90_06105 [Cytobacillus kochii]|uniref:capsular polysaccharide export protein, LipB/KpsS family n=1 Tax=Cytobacillus kochii TaxID=859143 RepID=UPI002E22D76D|nr:hypothetical protein [Cytobacillus kochii]
MANFMFVRGNRNKRFFNSIGEELMKNGHKAFLIKLELGELFINAHIKTVFAPFKVTDKEYPISDDELLKLPIYNITYTQLVLQKKIKKKELQTYKRYMYFIDQYIDDNEIDKICLFNGYHWIDQITKLLAIKKGLSVYYFEDGLFRPYTITLDPKGINADSSVSKKPSFYDNLNVDSTRLNTYIFTPENEELNGKNKENLVKVALMKMASFLGGFCRIHPRYYAHINLWQASKYFIFKKIYPLIQNDEVNLDIDYVFVPFQVSRDTQIFYNSPNIKSMEELLYYVTHAIEKYNRIHNTNIKVVVKEHPEDIPRNSYRKLKNKYKEDVIFIRKFDMKSLLANSRAVITINSTVGIEALANNKRVITLGNALYNVEGVVEHCANPKKLYESLQQSLHSAIDITRINKFIYFLRFKYQVEGTLNNSNRITARNVARKLMEELEKEVSLR